MDQIQALMQVGAKASLFPPTSRYHAINSATFVAPDGRTIAYLQRRFVPPPENFALILQHTVVQGDRLDNLASQYLGDPIQFWRICDANATMNPNDLTDKIGGKIRITLPEGIPGVNYG